MKHCMEKEKKLFWTCETSDANFFICDCCNLGMNEICRDRYFKEAFLVNKNTQSRGRSPEYKDYHYIDDDDEYYEELDNKGITHLSQLYEECKKAQILPLWCRIQQNYMETTVCSCNYNSYMKNFGFVHFNSTDIWNENACEVTKEYNDYLQNQKFYNIIFYCFWAFVIISILLIFMYIIYRKFKGRIFKQDSDDNETMILE